MITVFDPSSGAGPPGPPGPAGPAGPAGPGSTFVFRPGGVASGNVYTTWATLYAALSATEGTRILEFDDAIVSPCVVPAGAWTMTDVTWAGRYSTVGQIDVEVVEGAVFTGLRRFQDRLLVNFTGATSPVSDFAASGDQVLLLRDAAIGCSGTGSFFSVSAGFGLTGFILIDGGALRSLGNPVVSLLLFSTVQFFGFAGAVVELATIDGSGLATAILIVTGSSAELDTSQPFFPGTLLLSNATKARWTVTGIEIAALTAAPNDFVPCDTSGGGFTVTLPFATNLRGQSIVVKKVSSDANALDVEPSLGDTLDGVATPISITAPLGSITVVSDGASAWRVV